MDTATGLEEIAINKTNGQAIHDNVQEMSSVKGARWRERENTQMGRLILTDRNRFATSWRVRGSIPGGGMGQNPLTPALGTTQPPSMGTGAVPKGKAARASGMGLTTHPNLVLGPGEN